MENLDGPITDLERQFSFVGPRTRLLFGGADEYDPWLAGAGRVAATADYDLPRAVDFDFVCDPWSGLCLHWLENPTALADDLVVGRFACRAGADDARH